MTNWIIEPRRAGKSTKLIQEAAEKDMYILCVNSKHRQSIVGLAKHAGLTIRYPLIPSDLPIKSHFIRSKGVLVDEGDLLLEHYVGAKIETITGTLWEEDK